MRRLSLYTRSPLWGEGWGNGCGWAFGSAAASVGCRKTKVWTPIVGEPFVKTGRCRAPAMEQGNALRPPRSGPVVGLEKNTPCLASALLVNPSPQPSPHKGERGQCCGAGWGSGGRDSPFVPRPSWPRQPGSLRRSRNILLLGPADPRLRFEPLPVRQIVHFPEVCARCSTLSCPLPNNKTPPTPSPL